MKVSIFYLLPEDNYTHRPKPKNLKRPQTETAYKLPFSEKSSLF